MSCDMSDHGTTSKTILTCKQASSLLKKLTKTKKINPKILTYSIRFKLDLNLPGCGGGRNETGLLVCIPRPGYGLG